AAQTGPKTAEVVAAVLGCRTHPDTGRRACLGLIRLSERHGKERLEAASARALLIKSPTYKSVEAILKTGFDKVALTEEGEPKRVVHENIRGGAYFDREEGETAASADEIEAQYLAEERFAIIHEPDALPSLRPPRGGRAEQPAQMPGMAVLSAVAPASRSVV